MRSRARSGFTIVELAVSMAITGVLLASFGKVLLGSSSLSSESRLALRAREESRRNLERVSDVLRGAAATTLSGFTNPDGSSSDLLFKTGTGMLSGVLTLGSLQELKWVPTPQAVRGVANPGRIVVVQNGTTTPICERVVGGTFNVVRHGKALIVDLATYYSSSEAKTTTVRERVLVALRN